MLDIWKGITSLVVKVTALKHTKPRSFNWSKFRNTKVRQGAGEMAQQLRALRAPLEDLGSIPSIHMAAHTVCYSRCRGPMTKL